jgi:hypothetical protein
VPNNNGALYLEDSNLPLLLNLKVLIFEKQNCWPFLSLNRLEYFLSAMCLLPKVLRFWRQHSIPARPARQKRRTQTGHPFLVEESDSNQAIPSTQRRSAPLGGWQPAAPGPSHHVTPNERRTSSASHAIHADITPPAQPCYSISSREDQQYRRFREMDENEPCSICVLRLGEACKTGRCTICSTYFHQIYLAEWLTTPTGAQNYPTW